MMHPSEGYRKLSDFVAAAKAKPRLRLGAHFLVAPLTANRNQA
jgi:hypothetical protein